LHATTQQIALLLKFWARDELDDLGRELIDINRGWLKGFNSRVQGTTEPAIRLADETHNRQVEGLRVMRDRLKAETAKNMAHNRATLAQDENKLRPE